MNVWTDWAGTLLIINYLNSKQSTLREEKLFLWSTASQRCSIIYQWEVKTNACCDQKETIILILSTFNKTVLFQWWNWAHCTWLFGQQIFEMFSQICRILPRTIPMKNLFKSAPDVEWYQTEVFGSNYQSFIFEKQNNIHHDWMSRFVSLSSAVSHSEYSVSEAKNLTVWVISKMSWDSQRFHWW